MFAFETCFPTVTHFAVAVGVLAAAEIIYVTLGFGSGLIAVGSLAALFPDIRDVVVMLLVVNIPAEIYIIVKERKAIRWKDLLLLFLGVAIGVPIGAWILQNKEPTFLLTILGGVLIAFGLFFFAPRDKVETTRERRLPKWVEPFFGLAAGLLAALFGTGGPPLIVLFQVNGAKKALFRANLMACFFFFSILRAPSYAFSGLLTEQRIVSSLLVLPAALIGAVIGNRIHVRMSEQRFKQLVSLCIAAIGAVLLFK